MSAAACEAGQMVGHRRSKGVTQPDIRQHGIGELGAGGRYGEYFGNQVGQVQHLHPACPQCAGEDVVFLLRTLYPGNAVEEQ
jgi:hypothetical protein